MNGWTIVASGDVTGVGPEVALKALAQRRNAGKFLLLGPAQFLDRLNHRLALDLPLRPYTGPEAPEGVYILEPEGIPSELNRESIRLAPGAPEAARAAVACLKAGAQLCLAGKADALVTAPVSKEAIIRSGQPFIGQTEYLSELAGTPRTVMMLLGPDDRGRWLRVALATTHLALRRVADALTADKIELAVTRAVGACRDLGLPRARVGVCGLNPHAGEGGKMGEEELTLIAPTLDRLRKAGMDIVGPLAADTLFHYALRGDYDAVVAMYHDQGLAPLKMAAFDNGVNWTLGLPFIRTSPDHGTAYDIAGRGIANPSSTLAAMDLAAQLVSRRVKAR